MHAARFLNLYMRPGRSLICCGLPGLCLGPPGRNGDLPNLRPSCVVRCLVRTPSRASSSAMASSERASRRRSKIGGTIGAPSGLRAIWRIIEWQTRLRTSLTPVAMQPSSQQSHLPRSLAVRALYLMQAPPFLQCARCCFRSLAINRWDPSGCISRIINWVGRQ